ncbi:GspE/PulE family protein [Thermodesulfobacteriota bacterium]
MSKPKKDNLKFGEVLVKEKILDEQKLAYLLEAQKQRSDFTAIGELAIEFGFMTNNDLNRILEKYKMHIMLGELFVELGLITPTQLQKALIKAKGEKKRLGQMLVDMKIIRETHLVKALSLQLNIPRIEPNLQFLKCDDLLHKVSEKFIRKYHILPAFKEEDVLTVIMSDPLNREAISSIKKVFRCEIEPAIATKTAIDNAINQYYAHKGVSGGMIAAPIFEEDKGGISKDLIIGDSAAGWDGDRIVNMVNYLITSAVMENVSDIHLEPQEDKLQIRYRVDGMLHHKTDLPKSLCSPLASRIKVLCDLDIAERRRHQDGRIEAKVMGQDVDMRVSTYVSVYGENIVIRVLKRESTYIDINQLGFTSRISEEYKKLLDIPSGIILVTGPTGSGKTTTLYASLNHLNDQTKKIITVEDPVEYTIEGVVQGKLNTQIGVTYPEFIKSMMRQDPDILMIGEIRDGDSAEATINAALTGHKVFSTFHTEDTTGALLRLMDMGIETYLISSTIVAILAQRLVRINCPFCREAYTPPDAVLKAFNVRDFDPKKWQFVQGRGCRDCNGSGFRGRTGIHELLVMNDPIRQAILNRRNSTEIRKLAREKADLISMREYGFYKSIMGITTPEEVLRIVYASESDEYSRRTIDEIISLCALQEDEGAELLQASQDATAAAGSGSGPVLLKSVRDKKE